MQALADHYLTGVNSTGLSPETTPGLWGEIYPV
jgi:hypothetical protein